MPEDGQSTGRNMQQHIKEQFRIKINLYCVGMNKCRLWECKVASYSDKVGGKIRCWENLYVNKIPDFETKALAGRN
jgi:hypothetical protein